MSAGILSGLLALLAGRPVPAPVVAPVAPPPPPPLPSPGVAWWPVPAAAVGPRRGPVLGGVWWTLTPAGLSIEGRAPVGTPGEPVTIRRAVAWFGVELRAASLEFGVPFEIMLACAAAETIGASRVPGDASAARREEPGFRSDMETPNKVSVGIMQTLLSTARESLGVPDLTCADLAKPRTSARAGAAYLAWQAKRLAIPTGFDPVLAGAAYNAGSVRGDPATGNIWRLACYPLGTGRHVTRFVGFYNDAVRVLRETPHFAGACPTFTGGIWPGQPGA